MTFLDLLFPPKTSCIVCNASIKSGYLCDRCKASLEIINGKRCRICGKPLKEGEICSDCLKTPHYFKQNVSPFEYEGIVKELIAKFKYFNERHLASFFADYMADAVKNMGWNIEVIVPVPLHRIRLDERGYNQSELLARELSYRLNIFMSKALRRVKNTTTQTALHREERMENVKGAFKVTYKDTIEGKNVLLVDDVLTTGATLDECAKALKENGAKEVYVVTIATGRM